MCHIPCIGSNVFRKAAIYGVEVKLELPRWGPLSGFVSYSNLRGNGYLPVTGGLFVVLLIGTILLVGALTFLPALTLTPILEHFLMLNGKLF